MTATLKALVLIGGPLVCGAALFAFSAPPQQPGVYVRTRQGVYPVSGYAEQSVRMFDAVSDKVQTAPGGARGWVQFFVVGDATEPAARCGDHVELFFVRIVDGEPAAYRPVATDVRRLDRRVCHVSSAELAHWGDAPDPIVKYYEEAKTGTSKPVDVLVALVVNNSDG